MAIPETILTQMKCCLTQDYHVAIEPILLKCGANACKDCINSSTDEALICFSCHEKHEKKCFQDAPVNKMAESVVQFFLKDLFKDLDEKILNFKQDIKENSLNDDFQIKIENIEVELDSKVESMINEINKHRDECMIQLRKSKLEFRSLIKRTNLDKLKSVSDEEKNENSYECFKEKQKELKKFQIKLKNQKEYINELKFIPSEFELLKEHLGDIHYGFQTKVVPVEKVEKFLPVEKVEKEPIKIIEAPVIDASWLSNSSSILSNDEVLVLSEMTKACKGSLLYRATRDNFTSESFHSRCDGRPNTLTIIKTNLNYVFGGYTSAKWTSDRNYSEDSNAFIFSLRRKGVSKNKKFLIKTPQYAILGYASYGPIFGSGVGSENDFYICDSSNTDYGSTANIGHSYECPEGHIFGDKETSCYLTGSPNRWLTCEIEVYQINPL